jgi:hypothetical protein
MRRAGGEHWPVRLVLVPRGTIITAASASASHDGPAMLCPPADPGRRQYFAAREMLKRGWDPHNCESAGMLAGSTWSGQAIRIREPGGGFAETLPGYFLNPPPAFAEPARGIPGIWIRGGRPRGHVTCGATCLAG